MKDQETTAEQALEEEARRHREAYSKLERERGTEIELLTTRWVPLMTPHTRVSPLWADAVPLFRPPGRPPILTVLLIPERLGVFSRKQVKECSK